MHRNLENNMKIESFQLSRLCRTLVAVKGLVFGSEPKTCLLFCEHIVFTTLELECCSDPVQHVNKAVCAKPLCALWFVLSLHAQISSVRAGGLLVCCHHRHFVHHLQYTRAPSGVTIVINKTAGLMQCIK